MMTSSISRLLSRVTYGTKIRVFSPLSSSNVAIPAAPIRTTFRLNSNFQRNEIQQSFQSSSCSLVSSQQRATTQPSRWQLPNISMSTWHHVYQTSQDSVLLQDCRQQHVLSTSPLVGSHSLHRTLNINNGAILHRKVFNGKENNFRQASRTLATKARLSDVGAKGRPVSRARTKQPALSAAKPPSEKMLVCIAYTTAEEYDLEGLEMDIRRLNIFQVMKMPQDAFDVVHVRHDPEPRSDGAQVDRRSTQGDIFFFRDGMVVFWNVEDQTMREVRRMLDRYERNPYNIALVEWENEQMSYSYTGNSTLLSNGDIQLSSSASELDTILEKYTFSNAMALSVKLAIWEAWLDDYVDSIMYIPELLREGKRLKMSRLKVMQKIGELFALKYRINLGSDLLITPDFYWDRSHLEGLYLKTCRFLNIPGRTKVVNEKLTHCQELAELMRTHLDEKHSLRLEWMIIALIGIEVLFEIVHYLERIFSGTSTETEEVEGEN